ncbi:MAG: ArsR/SmtB family transcription factor [Pseudomonadota bacterium]
MADMFKALGNPHRLALFRRMFECCVPGTACPVEGELSVSELAQGLAIAPSTLSHHLKELNRAGLVTMERRGKRVFCRVAPEAVETLRELFTPNRSRDHE